MTPYEEFCHSEPNLSIFFQPWWLEAVAANSWNAIIVKRGEKTGAVFLYTLKQKYIYKLIVNPDFTPWLGCYIPNLTSISTYEKITLQNELNTQIIEKLPSF